MATPCRRLVLWPQYVIGAHWPVRGWAHAFGLLPTMKRGDRPRRRSHTVQAALLKRFADEKGRLKRVPLAGASHIVSVRDATVLKDFYAERRDDGTIDDTFERSLDHLEAPLTPLLRALIDKRKWPIEHSERRALAMWVTFQLLRTPATRSFEGDVRDIMFRKSLGLESAADLGAYLEARGRTFNHAELDDLWEVYREQRGATVGGDAASHIGMMDQFAPDLTDMVLGRGWTFVHCNSGLVTTDHPVAVRLPTKPDAAGQLWGVAGEIVVALDRHVALIVGEDPGSDRWIDDGDHLTDGINLAIVTHARIAVFHHPSDDPLKGIWLPQPYRRHTSVEEWLESLVTQQEEDVS
jgi:hypothetical protein